MLHSNLYKFYALSLLLLLTHNNNIIRAALFDGCDHEYNINAGTSVIQSPYWPEYYNKYDYYQQGTSCRYKFNAPLDYDIEVNCTIEMDKGANSCSTEYFYLARDGDKLLRDSEQFCGSGTFSRKSVFRSVTMAYVSGGSSGRFQCTLYAAPQPCDCGWSVNSKILNGVEASSNEYVGMVALRDKTSSASSFCGAQIISHNSIVTAAHCVATQQAANIVARVGDHDLSSSSESRYAAEYAISQIIMHGSYIPSPEVKNDIAILRTSSNIEWSRGVGPICLPPASSASSTFSYENVDLIGWGTVSFGGPVSPTLQKITLQVIDNLACSQQYQGVSSISSTQICTYDSLGKSRDSCQFDSGGPVILRKTRMFLLGIISFGKSCGQGGYSIGVNTRITSYLDWINQQTGYASCNVAL